MPPVPTCRSRLRCSNLFFGSHRLHADSRRRYVTCQGRYNGYTMTIAREAIAEPSEPDELFAAFANTLQHTRGEPHDAIPDVDALLDWLRSRGLISARGKATEAARLRRDPDEGI